MALLVEEFRWVLPVGAFGGLGTGARSMPARRLRGAADAVPCVARGVPGTVPSQAG